MQPQIESGAELLTRLNEKPSLHGLEDTLFSEGPQNTDIIEIGGERSCGKTFLLSQMLARCILPNNYAIKGCNASAILINTDHHFQTSKLVELMSSIVNTANISFSEAIDTEFDKTTIIKDSLRNLHIIDCYNNEQFSLTLHTLDDIFLDNTKIALLAIDSITAYYWQDCEDNITTIDTYIKKLLKIIKLQTTRFNVATIYTKLCESIHNKRNYLTNNIDYKIQLCKVCNSTNFLCTLETIQIIRKIHYSILSNGIKWKIDEREG
ncbi:DNA repair protein XRCC2-like [Bombus huntii]|uniref:DNA repair protein XRCC2-like n=1 Tax=Bombus huntii TaxID=85661 RepID=UPI0021AAAE10|nr:DNA repair protein XRCC2-like [Bombus huntii]XP_050472641.1 DNA repair protein XRCC2-like [Bombus huntii]XP_050472642.1 DNA repair protein XRCC2-like [Bombus huntii]XP_050472643.1 DNA repair protein XRCC2-like [Bombus huntii]XP_050472644.1 DNA repair protein XRCC2-like [Bombus huntii]